MHERSFAKYLEARLIQRLRQVMPGRESRLLWGLLGVALLGSSAQAQTYRLIYSFTGGSDGANPSSGLVQDSLGNLCGTTSGGGAFGHGATYTLLTGGESVLYSFAGGSDGGSPAGGLLADPEGHLYGTTQAGGGSGCGGFGCRTVCKVKVKVYDQEKVLYQFTGGIDGATPSSGLAQDKFGNVWGVTFAGGSNGAGVIYKLTAAGGLSVLYSFTGHSDGGGPIGVLYRDTSGNFFGVTSYGGNLAGSCAPKGCGVVFELSSTGKYTVLYSFTGGADGSRPAAGLIRDPRGNFYGTTQYGGNAAGCRGNGCGVVFKLDTTNKESVLYTFSGGTDGAQPMAALVRDSSGNLYGTTAFGGHDMSCDGLGCGVVFSVNSAKAESVLHTFTGTDGANPSTPLFRNATTGAIYGTTPTGGAFGFGVAFEVLP